MTTAATAKIWPIVRWNSGSSCCGLMSAMKMNSPTGTAAMIQLENFP